MTSDRNGYTVGVDVAVPELSGEIQTRVFHHILQIESTGKILMLEYAPHPGFLFVDKNDKLRGGFGHLFHMSRVRNIYRLD